MKAVVIVPKNKNELKFVNELLRKLEIASSVMSEVEMEDVRLARLMKSADRSKKVSRDVIMKKLKS